MFLIITRLPLIIFAAIALFNFSPEVSAVIRDGEIDPANLGKGDWIYSMKDATNKLGGHIASVTNEVSLMKYYKSIGVCYIIIKMGTGSTNYTGCYTSPNQITTNLCTIARTNGIWIFGYTRSYGSDIAGEVALANYNFNCGADGFVFDAEAEWEQQQPWIGANGPALAWQLCSMVRSNWPTKFLAHAPFPIISLHSSFPYKEFGYWCDAAMPQIYHFSSSGIQGSPSAAINWSDVNWRTWQNSLVGSNSVINGQTIFWTNSIKPILPLQDVYGETNNVISRCNSVTGPQSDLDVMEFIDYSAADPNSVTVGGYKGINFWRADLHGTNQFAYIKAGTSGDLAGVVNNIVMDDAKASVVGSWTAVKTFGTTSSSTPVFYGDGSGTDNNSFGTNYWVKGKGTGTAYMQFRPAVLVDGQYDVLQWHVNRADAATNTPFLINYSGGSATVFANQQTNSGNWTLLGRFNFAAGTNGYIRILDNFTDAASVAVVDGLKLVFVPPTSVPAAPTNLSAVAVSTSQINLSWSDASTNEISFVVARSLVSGGPYTDIATLNANSTNYSNTNLLPNTTYYFVVRATNSVGSSANSTPASATTFSTVPSAPTITTQPQSQTVIAGTNVSFSVAATGNPPPGYQWLFNSSPISGATNSTYLRTNVQPIDAGAYSVIVSNTLGSTNSASAMLTVNYSLTVNTSAGGSVSRSPNLTSYTPGSTVSLTATPAANSAFDSWSGDANGTNNPLSVTMTTNKSITANFVTTLTDIILDNLDPDVTYVGDWTIGTASVDKYASDYRYASSVAGGTSNVTYRPRIGVPGYYDVFVWYPQGGNRAPDAPWTVVYNGGSVTIPVNQQAGGGQWNLISAARPFLQGTNGYVRIYNNAGGLVVLADAVRFTYAGAFPTPPVITSQPQSQTGRVGTNVTFSAMVTGSSPFSYQWRFGANNILGATNPTYTQFNVQTNDAGPYSVVVTNEAGSVTSSNAILTIVLPTPPQFQSITRLFDGSIDLIFTGDAGVGYWIDRTTNFIDWEPLTNIFSPNGTVEFIDNHATNSERGFYRTRE